MSIQLPIQVLVGCLLLWFVTCSWAQSEGDTMTLDEAEKLALRNSPLVAHAQAMRDSLSHQSEAAGTWPDPKLKLGVMNFPTEEFNFEKEAMTQGVLGFTQRFPPWGAVGAKREQLAALSDAGQYELDDRKLKTLRNVRMSWLSVYFSDHSRQLITESLEVFEQLKKITRLQYRAGRGKQQDVIRAQLEESLLRDKETAMQTAYEKALAGLKQSLNVEKLTRSLDKELPELPQPPSEGRLEAALESHPWLRAGQNRVKAAKNSVEFANSQFRPGWSLDVSYGFRGADRGDLVTMMMMFDLPLFTGSRQSRQLESSQSQLSAERFSLDDRRRQLRRQYDDNLAAYARTDERLKLYETELLPQAEQNTEASLNGYQSGVNSFNLLVRARLTELNSRLQHLGLEVDRARAQVELLYLAGDR